MTFNECVIECIRTPDLVAQFDRLKGTNLSLRGTELDLKIDLACNRLEGDVAEFAKFVKEVVWDRMESVDEENGL